MRVRDQQHTSCLLYPLVEAPRGSTLSRQHGPAPSSSHRNPEFAVVLLPCFACAFWTKGVCVSPSLTRCCGAVKSVCLFGKLAATRRRNRRSAFGALLILTFRRLWFVSGYALYVRQSFPALQRRILITLLFRKTVDEVHVSMALRGSDCAIF